MAGAPLRDCLAPSLLMTSAGRVTMSCDRERNPALSNGVKGHCSTGLRELKNGPPSRSHSETVLLFQCFLFQKIPTSYFNFILFPPTDNWKDLPELGNLREIAAIEISHLLGDIYPC